MKIIHCADLHLDSRMTANLDKEKAGERNNEILITFCNMVSYGADHGVSAVIIAGDMFDTGIISPTTRNTVISVIENNPQIIFYYLKGNHDYDNFLSDLGVIPDNLRLFSESWTKYTDTDNGVVIAGAEIGDCNSENIYSLPSLDTDKYNIVVLHGQITLSSSEDGRYMINLGRLRGKNIDYLALGHIHSFAEGELDRRGIYCYPGCLEGRGFDECGEHGFVLLDIDTEKLGQQDACRREFIPYAKRRLYEVAVDITECRTSETIADRISEKLFVLQDEMCITRNDLIKIVLTGSVDISAEKNIDYLTKKFENDFYFFKISDRSVPSVDYSAYAHDMSLKGEFVRSVMGDDSLGEADKAAIIRYGIRALGGEDLD